ncbi:hypothetical protein ABKN59_002755 [Abortiporus biennis]
MPDLFVKSFTHLKDRPKADKALPFLQRVASLVKPIMRKHGWVLPSLAEFFPESPNLVGLNVNAGQKILLRLRPAWAPDTFYEEEEVVHVMLHELTHNVHGPHNDQFYTFLSGLEAEYEALKKSGYAGEGFHSKGRRLGENVSHDLPSYLARAKALEAAEKRRKVSAILGGAGGGRRLGGASTKPYPTKSPRELAAEAAERRARDEKACGTGQLAQHEAEKAAKDSIEDVIDLTQDSEPEVELVESLSSSSSRSSFKTVIRSPDGHITELPERPSAVKGIVKQSARSHSVLGHRTPHKKLPTPPPTPSEPVTPENMPGTPLSDVLGMFAHASRDPKHTWSDSNTLSL